MSIKLSQKNKIIIACAGAGKTTYLVDETLKVPNSERILLTTYTNENIDQIKDCYSRKISPIPQNITIKPWVSFLLQDGVRPYQNQLISDFTRVKTVHFQQGGNTRYHQKNAYFTKSGDIYSNKLSEFVYECNKASDGKVINRLEQMYDLILIDELQDFGGYDLEFLEQLFKSNIRIIAVGDPRQATYSTNQASKNKQYRGEKIYDWIKLKESKNQITLEEINETKRYGEKIAKFADSLYPQMPSTTSNVDQDSDSGIFAISREEAPTYIAKYVNDLQILRYDKRSDTLGYRAMNIGLSKGRTYERVLVFPTSKMVDYLKSKDINKAGKLPSFYVAVTRARLSVCFVLQSEQEIQSFNNNWRV